MKLTKDQITYAVGFVLALAFLVTTLICVGPTLRRQHMGSVAYSRLQEALKDAPVVMQNAKVLPTPTAGTTLFKCTVASKADKETLETHLNRQIGPELMECIEVVIEATDGSMKEARQDTDRE